MLNKFNIKIKNPLLSKIFFEHIKKKNKIIHSFFIFLITANSEEVNKININKNKSKIIPSDYIILKSRSNKKIKTIISQLKN